MSLRISINARKMEGPYGGGNQFANTLDKYLCSQGDQTFRELVPGLDLILILSAQEKLKITSYDIEDIADYLIRNPKTVIVQRVNTCNEQRGADLGINQAVMQANRLADHTVFVSTWLKDLHLSQGFKCSFYSVILNGSDHTMFHSKGYKRWDKKEPMRLVTHHWGGNWMKGFDIYERLDELLQTEPFKHTISFTYIGNLPKDFHFKNATYVEPIHGVQLASLIRQHHVYLTASQNEPGANHQNEGASCGLPLLYRESGCLPEYCNGFGISFTEENFEEKLHEMLATYDYWVDRMENFCHMAERMCDNYCNLFMELLEQREEVLKRRRWWRKPTWLVKSYLHTL